jgi:hypothetical protein
MNIFVCVFVRICKKANDSHEEECEVFKSSTRIQC